MSEPSPLHRHPESDGDDYGCFTPANNRRVARVVELTLIAIESGIFDDGEDVIDFVRSRLRKIPSACDTVVKENVFLALDAALAEAGIELEEFAIYGW